MVSGWKVGNSDSWELIGKKDPQQPQTFYPVGNPQLSLTRGDVVAARCTMVNTRDRTTFVGATKEDEMCNFFIMYWVEGDSPMDQTTCFSAVEIQYRKCLNLAETPLIQLGSIFSYLQGPPTWSWAGAGLSNIPDIEASTL